MEASRDPPRSKEKRGEVPGSPLPAHPPSPPRVSHLAKITCRPEVTWDIKKSRARAENQSKSKQTVD